MSKQLTLSAIAAALTMGFFALSAGAGYLYIPAGSQLAGHAPLFDLNARF